MKHLPLFLVFSFYMGLSAFDKKVSLTTVAQEKVPQLFLSLEGLSYFGKKPGGSSPGAVFRDLTGTKYIVKYLPEAAALNEFIASQLYRLAGVTVPNTYLIKASTAAINKLPGEEKAKIQKLSPTPNKFIAVEFIEGLQSMVPANLAKDNKFLDGFLIDAWLGNYDVVGLENDNVMMDGKDAVRIDIGAALLYRASGAAKGDTYTDKEYKGVPPIGELNFLIGELSSEQAATLFPTPETADPVKKAAYPQIRQTLAQNSVKVFSGLKKAHVQKGFHTLAKLSDIAINNLVEELQKKHGASLTPAENKELSKLGPLLLSRKHSLLSRKDAILNKFKK